MIYVICGPTASGKSKLAEELAAKLKAPIVNGDVFQMYKEMNIGTAKPSCEILNDGNHYLFNTTSVVNEITIYEYQIEFRKCIEELQTKYNNIIVVGGAGLYIKSAMYDYVFNNTSYELDEKYKNMSNEQIYECLVKLDPISASKIHVNNRKRVERAIEICLSSDLTKSQIENKQSHKCLYDARFIALDLDRALLYRKINARVDEMFKNGLPEEATSLLNVFSHDLLAFQAIGYKEFLQKDLSIEEIKELIMKNTRNYAKRQMTFFRHQFDMMEWYKTPEEVFAKIV